MASQGTRVLFQFPSKYQEKEALEDHRASRDQVGSEGNQGQRAYLGILVGNNYYAFVVEHLKVKLVYPPAK